VLYFTEGSHSNLVRAIEDNILIGGWWVLLGILSSVGLGTGLHTFVLYLGPYIAKVTMAAWECGTVNFLTHGAESFICPEVINNNVSMWGILRKVQLEALLWGAGTAIGELPPYFVARAARLAGEKSEELDELEQELEGKSQDNDSALSKWIVKTKKVMFSLLGNLGFFGILLFASIPNPLFDLAGITCGHFLVPFWTFFGATLIGKSVVKAHIQTIFVITMFSKQLLAFWISIIESFLPFSKGFIDEYLEKERAKLHRAAGHQVVDPPKSILAQLWDLLLIIMLAYFITSLINSSVQDYLFRKDEKELEKLRETQQNNNEPKQQSENTPSPAPLPLSKEEDNQSSNDVNESNGSEKKEQ